MMGENKMFQDRKRERIKEIIEIEWEMFDRVNHIDGRAECQDDYPMFFGMRYSYYEAFSEGTLEHYRKELKAAQGSGRNVITEKYAYMMEYTDPEYYKNELKKYLPEVSGRKKLLVEKIAKKLTEYETHFVKKYPLFGKAGRPVMDSEEDAVSSQVYSIGELKTYSMKMLQLVWQDIQEQEMGFGENIVFRIHENVARFYGYENVAAAEKALQMENRTFI